MRKSGRLLARSIGSVAEALPASKRVPAVAARCPPAEKPISPMRAALTPYSCARRADEPQGALRVAKLDRVAVLRTEAVLEDEGRDAHRVEVRGHLPSFVVHRQRPVPAARRHDDAGARGTAAAR